jgi:integrase
VIDDYLSRDKDRLRAFGHYVRYGRIWKAAFPKRALAQILPGDVERYVALRRQQVSPASVNRELAFLRRLYNVAIADQRADTNPVSSKVFFKENNARVRFLSDDEEVRLRDVLDPTYWVVVLVAIHTGLRRSEQFNLRWEHVDFTNGIITVPRSKHGEVRRVRMNDTVRDILRSLPSRLKSAYVFPSASAGDRPLDGHHFVRRVFVPALAKAGIEGFRWHDLRHTFASRLTMAGVDLRTVQELMGHKTMLMTLRYSHLSPEHQLDAVQRLNAAPTATTTATESETAKSTAGGVA